MRILRLDLGSGQSVDLHPFVTILAELDEAARLELLEAVRTIARGSTAGIRGLVQNQGLLVELDGLGDDRLPAVTGANVVIDGHRSASDSSWLQAQVDQQQRRAEIAAVMVEEIRADVDPSARARVSALEERVAPADDDQTRRREARIERVTAALAALDRIERVIVESPSGVPELQARLQENSSRRAEAKGHFKKLDRDIDLAQSAVDEARVALRQANGAAKPVLLTREEEARLELLSFPAADESRRGKWKKTLRPAERSEMDSLLRKVGVESYTAYTVYRASPSASQDRMEEVATAEATLAEAESILRSAQRTREDDRLYQELTAETKALREQARGFLGMMLPADVAQGLGALTVRKENPEWDRAAAQVGSLLDELGIDRGDDGTSATPTPPAAAAEAAVAGANAWLRAQGAGLGETSIETIRRQLETERGALDRHRRALARIARAEAAAVEAALGLAQLQDQLAASTAEQSSGVDGLLAFIEPIATQVTLEARGSLPIALVGELEGLDDGDVAQLMVRLSEISEDLQVLLLTDRPEVLDWVADVGLNRAMVSRARVGVVGTQP